MSGPLTYLACPYMSASMVERGERFAKVSEVAARLASQGENIFSPISHFHPLAMHGELPGDWAFWERIDRLYLGLSSRMIVLKLPGWEESVGVTAEIKIAEEMGIPITYMEE